MTPQKKELCSCMWSYLKPDAACDVRERCASYLRVRGPVSQSLCSFTEQTSQEGPRYKLAFLISAVYHLFPADR